MKLSCKEIKLQGNLVEAVPFSEEYPHLVVPAKFGLAASDSWSNKK